LSFVSNDGLSGVEVVVPRILNLGAR